MINKKTDAFSRVVAFITALAIAMLTVTLIHRTTISAEEAFIEASDNYGSSEDGSESQEPADTGEVSDITAEPPADTGEEPGSTEEPPADTAENPADNDVWNDDTVSETDVDDYNDGIALLANITISDTKKRVDANVENAEIVKAGSCTISKADDKPLNVGEEVYDGEALRFMFNWTIDDSIPDAFNDKVLVYDITKQLHGIALNDNIYPLQTADGLEAVYQIQNIKDANGNVIQTLMLIEPIKGFQANSTGRHGSIKLDGAVKLSDFKVGETDVELVFVDAKADVTAPSLNNSITPSKSCMGSPELDTTDGRYYQNYRITLENYGKYDSDAATVIDIPGSALKDNGPIQANITYDANMGNNTPKQITGEPNGSGGYTFSVEPIKAGTIAYIDYKMEVDTDTVLDPDISTDALKNTVTVNGKSSSSTLDPNTIRPKIEKSGRIVDENGDKKIEWTITIRTNEKGAANFTVTDILDKNLQMPGDYGTGWTKEAFDVKVENGVYVYTKTYTTDFKNGPINHQTYTNTATVAYGNDEYDMQQAAAVTYIASATFADKNCTGLNADGKTIGWTISIKVPDRDDIKNIIIDDHRDWNKPPLYGGNGIYGDKLFAYDTNNMKIICGANQWDANTVGSFSSKYDDGSYGKDIEGFELTINPDFLKNVKGKTITIRYDTSLINGYDIDLLTLYTNSVKCTINYPNKDSLDNNDEAEYNAGFAVEKVAGDGNFVASGDRNQLNWRFAISGFTNAAGKRNVSFIDKLPNGYMFIESNNGKPNPIIQFGPSWYPDEVLDENAVNVTFNTERTEMYGTIRLTNDQIAKITNDNYMIFVTYSTQMTEEYYDNFNTLSGKQSFTNDVSVTIGGATNKASFKQDVIPDNTKILNKTSGDTPNQIKNVPYTITVNKGGKHLGTNNQGQQLILTDTLGKYLTCNNDISISPNGNGEDYDYDPISNKITFYLNNETEYEINYTVDLYRQLSLYEYDLTDSIDNERDESIIHMLYDNKAELEIPNGNSVEYKNHLSANVYRSRVEIYSNFKNNFDSGDKINLMFKKTWDDTANPDAVNGKINHDEEIKVKIEKYYADDLNNPINGSTLDVYIIKDVNHDGDEYYKLIKDLPASDTARNKYVYKVVSENNIPVDYECTVSPMTAASGNDAAIAPNTNVITVTNTYVDNSEKVNLTVKKDWKGDKDTSKRNASVEVVVKRDGKDFNNNKVVFSGNKWEHTFNNLPKSNKATNTDYEYTVVENTKNEYYQPVITSSTTPDGKETTFTITNKYRGETDISVTKEWDGDTGYTHLRSGAVDYTIYQDDNNGHKVVYKTGQFNDEDGWSYSCKVPLYSDVDTKTQYVYTVEENTVNPYYTTSITDNGKDFTIKNTFKPIELTTITVTKEWLNDTGHDDLRSDSVDFVIVQNNRIERFYELNEDNEWTQDLELPKYFNQANNLLNNYDVFEKTNNPNYTSTVESSPDGTTFTIKNTFKPISITITKNWTGENDPQETRPNAINVTLLQNGKKYRNTPYQITGSKDINTWSCTIDDLPQYDKDGNPYVYTISEESITDYKLTLMVPPTPSPTDSSKYQASLTNEYTSGIINNDELIDITVTKIWSDAGYSKDKRTDVMFDLMQNGVKYGETHTIEMEDQTGDNWEYTIQGLRKYDNSGAPYDYTIQEHKVNGYDTRKIQDPNEQNVYNAVISNKYIPPAKINIPVTKSWDDEGYAYKRDDVTLILKQNGTECDRYTLSAVDNIKNDVWNHTFKNIPQTDENGNAYTYTVEEEPIDGYTSNVTNTGNNWSITNKYIVPNTPPPVIPTPGPDDPTPGPDDPTPGPDDPTPGPDDPTPGPDDPTPGPDDPTPGPDDPTPGPDDPTPGPDDPTPGTEPIPGPRPPYPPSGTTPVSPTVTEPKEPERHEEPEDVSSEAGFFDEEFDAVRRDDIMILILAGIIITGTLTLAFRHRSDKSDGKYHM